MALVLRVLTRAEWDADDLRLLDACWRTATRADLFAEEFEAERDRIGQLVAAARADSTARSWAARVGPVTGRKGGRRAAASPVAEAQSPGAAPAAPAQIANEAPPPPTRCSP